MLSLSPEQIEAVVRTGFPLDKVTNPEELWNLATTSPKLHDPADRAEILRVAWEAVWEKPEQRLTDLALHQLLYIADVYYASHAHEQSQSLLHHVRQHLNVEKCDLRVALHLKISIIQSRDEPFEVRTKYAHEIMDSITEAIPVAGPLLRDTAAQVARELTEEKEKMIIWLLIAASANRYSNSLGVRTEWDMFLAESILTLLLSSESVHLQNPSIKDDAVKRVDQIIVFVESCEVKPRHPCYSSWPE